MNSKPSKDPQLKDLRSSDPTDDSGDGSVIRLPSPSSGHIGAGERAHRPPPRAIPRPGRDLDDATLAAIGQLPPAAREILVTWAIGTLDELEEARRQLRSADDTARRAFEIEQARERTRLARELHDNLGGDLAAAVALFKYFFESPSSNRATGEVVLRNVFEILETSLKNLRGMLRTMRSRELGTGGLVPDLRDLAKAYKRYHNMDVLLEVLGEGDRLAAAHQEVAFQVVREALSNVRRHSGCRTCLVKLDFKSRPFLVEITDWGVGIAEASSDGFGLIGMRERAAGIGGRLHVDTAKGRGTSIYLFGPDSSSAI